MSFTYSTLKTAIQAYTENDAAEFVSVLDTIIDISENRIYRDLDLEEWRRYDTTLTLTVGDNTLDFISLSPRPFVVRWVAIKTNTGTVYTLLDQKDDIYIQEFWGSTATNGIPRVYSTYGDTQLLFGPTPDGTYNVKLAYTVKPTSIIAGSTSWLGSYAPDLFLYRCLAESYDFMKGEEQARTRWEGKYKETLDGLILEEERRRRRTEYRTGEQAARA